MQSTDIRFLIREILQEEMVKLRGRASSTETIPDLNLVSIDNDADLNAFAKKLASLCLDSKTRQSILNGQLLFSLNHRTGNNSSRRMPPQNTATVTFDKGLINEKVIDDLADGTKIVNLGPRVRLTPLALDRLRQKGITFKKVRS